MSCKHVIENETSVAYLMSVGGALVRSDGNDGRVARVGDVVDGQGILVVGVADIAS
jgi:hypothetical protein